MQTSPVLVVYSPGAQMDRGHAATYVSGLGSAFASMGYEVLVVAHAGPQPLPQNFSVHEAPARWYDRLLRVLPTDVQRHAFRLLAEPRLLSELKQTTSQHEYSILLMETFEYRAMARYLRAECPPAAFCIFHSTTFRSERHGLLRSLYKRSSMRAAQTIAMSVDKVFVHGAAMRRNLVNELRLQEPQHVSVVPTGAPDPCEVGEIGRQDARTQLGLPASQNILLSFGTLRSDKDFRTLLIALAEEKDWVFVHAGPEGDMTYEDLTRLISEVGLDDRFILHPRYIPAEEHSLYFAAADLLGACYLDSVTHDSGTANRARSFGRLVLASGPEDLTQYVLENDLGFICDSNDVGSVRDALRGYANMDEDDRRRLESHVRSVAKQLSWPFVAQRMLESPGRK